MPDSCYQIEIRIAKTIDVLNIREIFKLRIVAREFDVSRERLRARHNDHTLQSAMRKLHKKRFTKNQDFILH